MGHYFRIVFWFGSLVSFAVIYFSSLLCAGCGVGDEGGGGIPRGTKALLVFGTSGLALIIANEGVFLFDFVGFSERLNGEVRRLSDVGCLRGLMLIEVPHIRSFWNGTCFFLY